MHSGTLVGMSNISAFSFNPQESLGVLRKKVSIKNCYYGQIVSGNQWNTRYGQRRAGIIADYKGIIADYKVSCEKAPTNYVKVSER